MVPNVETLLNYFSQVRRYYALALNRRFADEDLSLSEISILLMLANNPSVTTATQLCVLLGVSKGLISRSVDNLRKRGLLECTRSAHDRRVVQLQLSGSGRTLTARLKQAGAEMNRELLADIPESDIAQMEDTMQRIISHFRTEDAYETENVKRS